MKRLIGFALGAAIGVSAVTAQQPPATPAPNAAPGIPASVLAKLAAGGDDDDGSAKKYEDFAKLTKGAKEFDGLFKLHLKDDRLLAEIAPQQFNTSYLAPMAVAQGAGSGGTTLDDEMIVLQFKRVGDKVHVVRKNTRFRAKRGTPEATAVETTYADSVLLALPIRSINPARGSVVVDFNQIFFGDFAQLGLGVLDPSRTTWHKVKAFPHNVELQVAATFAGGRGTSRGGSDAVIDPRGATVVLHYGLVEMPDAGYTPRLADDRIGYFVTAVKDFSGGKPDTNYVRYVNRWRLERADGTPYKEGAKLVPPKKRIVYWIEKSVPDEYRAAVREGILEWNKAFAKVGFRDAIEVRQQESEEFDPEDMKYNTFRWITNEGSYAIGPSRVNPYTGEILDADILFDAAMVRFYKQEGHVYRNGTAMEPASTIQAARRGLLLPAAGALPGSWDDRTDPAQRLRLLTRGLCQASSHKASELGLAMMSLAAQANLKPGEKYPDELIQQAVKETVMHEVGHTLGLRHNFKASTVLPNDKLHDPAVTRKEGLVGSVMDYNPINLAPKGTKQGDYFTSTVGPYDYWAIEYGYKPDAGADELAKIASRCADPKLTYGTDEDMYGTSDPLVNQWDLGSDPMKFAQDRAALAAELLKGLADRVVDNGEGYQRTRQAFGALLKQYGDAAFLNAKFVGGEQMYRDHKGDPNARDPFVPVAAAQQRAALKFLRDNILTDVPFQFQPELLRKLAADRWMHWGTERMVFSSVDYPVNERVLAIQKVVLDELLDAETLSRVQNLANKSAKADEAVTLAEVFRSLTEGVWIDLPNGKPLDKQPQASVLRRNLQREYLKDLSQIVLGNKAGQVNVLAAMLGGESSGAKMPADAKSLARLHLREIGARIDKVLMASAPLDDTTRAHLDECKERIAKVLAASMQVRD